MEHLLKFAKGTHQTQQSVWLCIFSFDHLVGAARHGQRDVDPERLGGLEVDVQLDFRCLLDRQIGRLRALENPAGIDAS
jgi:hypothetical protein